jgi:hypothetical protein
LLPNTSICILCSIKREHPDLSILVWDIFKKGATRVQKRAGRNSLIVERHMLVLRYLALKSSNKKQQWKENEIGSDVVTV